MKYRFFILFMFILLFSCKVIENKENSKKDNNKYESGIDNIRHNLERDKIDLFEAYILIKKEMSKAVDQTDDKDKYDLFLTEVINKMNDKLVELYETKDYDGALRYAFSLKAIEIEPKIGFEDIYRNFLISIDNSSDIFTKLSIKNEMAENKIFTTKEVYDFLIDFYNSKNIALFLYNYEKLITIYPSLLTEYPDLKKMKESFSNYQNKIDFNNIIKSVVTVILDKGINIKDGSGYFDKMIGTGFFIDDNGYILTNHHVIADHVDPKYEGFSKVYVSTSEDPDTNIPATVVGYDKVFDLALLKISKKNSNKIILGRSPEVNLGDKIYAIGNPLGIKNSVTAGIISNKELYLFQLGKALQIDAAVNPGNSGGPLLDENGQVIGVVFAGLPQYQGINFAIPIQWVTLSLPKLYKGGEVKRCWLGAGIYNQNNKILIYYLLPNGPAEKADIKEGDYIRKIDGKEIKTIEQAHEILACKRYPMLINIEIERDGNIFNKIVRLEERPYLPLEKIVETDTQRRITKLIFGIELDYYGKGFLTKKFKILKVYTGMTGDKDLQLAEGDPFFIYDMKYMAKEKILFIGFLKMVEITFGLVLLRESIKLLIKIDF